MVVHLFLNNNKALDFLPINSIKNGGITQLSESQLSALRVLIRCLIRFFNINKLGGHKEFALSEDVRTCPGSVAMEKIVELRKEFNLQKP